MKIWKRVASVGLSLALCAGMVAPAFAAASFGDLQDAINGGAPGNKESGVQIGDTGRYGYGQSLAEDGSKYEIEAWDEGGIRNIQLNANVEFDKAGDDQNRADSEGNGAIYVWRSDKGVSIDLNGHDIDMNPDAKLDAETGKFYDENGGEVASGDLNKGTVIKVTQGADLTINDSSALDEEGNYVAGQGTGKITGGNAQGGSSDLRRPGVGAVYVDQNSSFTMNGGAISGNYSDQSTLCAENPKNGSASSTLNVTLNGVTVENNRTEEAGTIYFVAKSGEVNVTIDGCEITGNVAEGDVIDFGIHDNGKNLTAEIKDTTITGNRVDKDDKRTSDHGGVAIWQGAGKDLSVTFDGCTIQDNEGGCTGIYYDNLGSSGLVITEGTNTICGNAGEAGKGNSVTYLNGAPDSAMHTDAYWKTVEETTEPEVIKEATYSELGLVRYSCLFCGAPHDVETPVKTPDVVDENNSGGETVIDDVAVPLAGLFTRADAIGYLWQQAGEPEAELSDFPDVDADHQWAVAIGWAQDMGIALPDLEGNFRPDDLVERFVEDEELKPEGELQEFLNRYAEYAGIELDEDELFYVLGGQADDIVMGEEAQVIFDDFFARLEAALAQAA